MDWVFEAKWVMAIASMFLCFFTIGKTAERTIAMAVMFILTLGVNVFSFVKTGYIDEFWMFALIVLGLYFIIRFWKGDFRHLFRKDALTSDDE